MYFVFFNYSISNTELQNFQNNLFVDLIISSEIGGTLSNDGSIKGQLVMNHIQS